MQLWETRLERYDVLSALKSNVTLRFVPRPARLGVSMVKPDIVKPK